jgi:hypothetical protein
MVTAHSPLEHFQAKWTPVRRPKMQQNKDSEHFQAKWIPVRKCDNTWNSSFQEKLSIKRLSGRLLQAAPLHRQIAASEKPDRQKAD